MTALTPELERKLGVAVERMPAFPRSVQKILELTRNINCLPKDLVGVIEKDPVMTMKILKVINSAYYGLPQKITSVGQSVVYLGINTIKNLALGFAAVGILPRMNAAGFDIQRYLLHSLVVGGTARQLATQFAKGEVDSGDAYIAGLLHDFGKVVFAQFLAAARTDMKRRMDLQQALVERASHRDQFFERIVDAGVRSGEIAPENRHLVQVFITAVIAGMTDALSDDQGIHLRAIEAVRAALSGDLVQPPKTRRKRAS